MIDLLVIGAGIIGSWVALVAARSGLTVAVCEAGTNARDGITGRNSGVLHAGIYYPPNSIKAKHCIRGRALAVEFAEKYGVPFSLCGKLIVPGVGLEEDRAGSLERLEGLFDNAKSCGARGLEMVRLNPSQYPHVRGDAGMLSKNTGVIDVPAYHSAVRHAAENAGAMFLMNRRFIAGESSRVLLGSTDREHGLPTGEEEEINAQVIVNAAGLHSDDVANTLGTPGYEIRPNRGEYYRLRYRLPFDRLVYPLPSTTSTALGVHYTFQLNGEAYAGPNSIWAGSKSDYEIEMDRREFHNSLNRILDCYNEEDLQPGYSGLRPRLFFKGDAIRDFVILRESEGVIHLLGIESPGLTSAPSLAEEVVSMIRN